MFERSSGKKDTRKNKLQFGYTWTMLYTNPHTKVDFHRYPSLGIEARQTWAEMWYRILRQTLYILIKIIISTTKRKNKLTFYKKGKKRK